MATKRQAQTDRAEWRARLASGRVVENIVGGERTLIGFPTREAAIAYIAQHPPQTGCASITRIYEGYVAAQRYSGHD